MLEPLLTDWHAEPVTQKLGFMFRTVSSHSSRTLIAQCYHCLFGLLYTVLFSRLFHLIRHILLVYTRSV